MYPPMGRGGIIGLLLVIVLMATGIVAGTTPAAARPNLAGQSIKTCIARVRAGDTPAAMFATPGRFDCTTPQPSFGPGDYWVISPPLSMRGEVALRSASLWQAGRTVYARYADGAIVARHTGSDTASRTLQLGAIFLDHLPARGVPLVRVVWRIDQAANLRGVVIGTDIGSMRDNDRANLYLAALYAAFAGLCVALMVHHLALWTAMRHQFQLAYCVMVAVMLGYAATASGAFAWAFPWIDNNDRLRLNYLGVGLVAVAAIAFARTFFEERVFDGWVGRATLAIAGFVLATPVLVATLGPWQLVLLDRLFTSSFCVLVLFVPLFLFRAWRVRSNYLWLFALAWSAPVAFAGVRIAANFNLIAWSFWVDNSTTLSMTAEALLSSLGITYRIRLLSRERDDARLKELAARALADADPLTGLLNRRAFLHQAIGREDDQVLLILDIDHFKAVNETIGHDGGDEVLLRVARALRTVAPDDALIARLGGEEFAMIMYQHSRVEGEDVLVKLRNQRMPFDLSVTASIGICTGPLRTETDWKRLYRQADRALYEAKTLGRDRARTGPPVPATV